MSIKQLTSYNVLFNPLHFDMGIYILNTVLKTSFYLHVYGADMENFCFPINRISNWQSISLLS